MKSFRIKLSLLLSVFIFLQGNFLIAQNFTTKISLSTCISKAIANNIPIKQSKLQIEINKNNLLISKFNQYPNLNGSFSQYFTAGRNIDPFTNQYTDQKVNYQNISLSSTTLLFGGNQLKNTVKLNELGVLVSEKEEKTIEEILTLNVVNAFFQVLNAEDILDIATKQLESTRFQIKRTETLLKEGVVSRSSVLDLMAQLAGDELTVADAKNTLEITKTNLLQILNEKKINKLELDRKGIILPSIELYKEPLNRIVAVGIETQAIVIASKLRSQMAKKNFEIALASKLPTISLILGIGTNYSTAAPSQQFVSDGSPSKFIENKSKDFVLVNGQKQYITKVSEIQSGSFQNFGYFNQLDFNFNKLLGISIKFPIFNAYSAKYKVENAKISKVYAEYQVKNTQIEIQNAIELAYKNMLAAYEHFNLIEKQLSAVKNAFELTKIRFEEGTINSLEYTLSKSNLDRVSLKQVQAKYDYIYRTKVLDFYLGRL